MIKLTIDGKEIELDKPVTILEAAGKAGIRIPTLCYFEGLSPFGGCRLCLVKVEKLPRLQTACTLMAADGMVVNTGNEQIKAARRAMLEFLLINHPLDCPVCDKAGECQLQDLVAEYGPDAGRFAEGKRTHPESFDDPIIVRNMERCLTCTRCIRMCNDLQGAYAISVTGRGSRSFVEPFSGGRYNCEYCGNCLTVCPVGAIMSRLHRHSYRPWFVEREVETVCGFCGVGCTMVLQMRENSIIRTIPRTGLGLNNGLLCVRGRFGYDFVESKERITVPMIRKDGGLRPASWDEALDFVAGRLREIRDKHGAGSIGAIASGRCSNEDNYMLQKLIRFVIGSNNIDSTARNFYAPAVSYLEALFGQGITANLIPGIANSDGIFVLGGDPTKINPILGLQIRAARRNGGKVITAGPSGGLKRSTDYELSTVSFGEEAVLSGIVGGLLDAKEPPGDNKKVEEQLKSLAVPGDEALREAGISPESIRAAVGDLKEMTTPVVIIGPEITAQHRPSKLLFLAGAIAYLTNARIFVLSERPNYQGLMDMGCLPDTLPGGRPIKFEMFRHKIEERVGTAVPVEEGLNIYEMVDASMEGRIRALYVMGENPVFNLPDRKKVTKSLESLNLLVVQDIFMTETAVMADVVFPASSWSEKMGTFTNLERRIQGIGKGRDLKGTREDWRILAAVANRMGMKETYNVPEDVWNEVSHVSPLHSGLNYEDVGSSDSIFPYHGEPLRGIEGDFSVDSIGRPPEIKAGEGYRIITERPLFHSGTLSRRSKALLSISSEPSLLINPSDAEELHVSDGSTLTVRTEMGLVSIKARISDEVPEKTVSLSNVFEQGHITELTGYLQDPLSGTVSLKYSVLTIEKSGDE
ncbi:putative formate dehydrogenase [bacterium BMS3Bbin06]|nr:putative formate dehydrogenase [bacterium BMS3Abin08]GBE34738.1 putative formate dehydrogenase [bacterium BMS3Bbin06]HDO36795.1 2Fe-2S iron-sulfur cluster binding domain-containing protein [Nitrospirota bacterium]